VLGCVIVLLTCVTAGCGQGSGSVKQAVSSFASGRTVPPATAPSSTAPAVGVPTTETSSPAQPSPAPAGSGTSEGTSGSPSLIWLWVALAAAAFIGLFAWIAHAHHKRGAAAADRNMQLIDAYAKGAALHDAMAAAEAPGALGSADAAARWFDIQRRADDYGQLLYALQETAPDDEERVRIANVLASLQAARSAMEAERSAGNAPGAMAGVVRDRLSLFATSLRDLREPGAGPM
jgi:hypothetical protein